MPCTDITVVVFLTWVEHCIRVDDVYLADVWPFILGCILWPSRTGNAPFTQFGVEHQLRLVSRSDVLRHFPRLLLFLNALGCLEVFLQRVAQP